jgi:hypothetical protein
MTFIPIVNEDQASAAVAQDYDCISKFYSDIYGQPIPAPQVYRSTSLLADYFRYCVTHVDCTTQSGTNSRLSGDVPGQLVAFAVSQHSSCFY